jgi:uncharacterized protein (DUF934 family)
MPLIRDDRIVEDPWITLADDDPLPQGARVIVTPERWHEARGELLAGARALGVRLRPDQAPELIAEDLRHFEVVALEFPKFTDGRAYSHARLLRERSGYAGELRAVGNVLRDQAIFMRRCGFDAFEVDEDTSLEAWLAALGRISVWYQPAADGRTPVYALRHANGAAASTSNVNGSRVGRANGSGAAQPITVHAVPQVCVPRGPGAAERQPTTHRAY